MTFKDYEEMKIDSDSFKEIRDTFDCVLQNLLEKMAESNSREGTLDLKLNINVAENEITAGDRAGDVAKMPTIKYKCQYTVPVKDGIDGEAYTGMELVYDSIDQAYVLRPVSLDGQMSIGDYMRERNADDAEEPEREPDEDPEEQTADKDEEEPEAESHEGGEEKGQSLMDAIMHGDHAESESDADSGFYKLPEEVMSDGYMNAPTDAPESTEGVLNEDDFREFDETFEEEFNGFPEI